MNEQQALDRKLFELQDRRRRVELGGGDLRILQQHERGKLTARERLELLLDPGSFRELNAFAQTRSGGGQPPLTAPGEGVVTGYGAV
ncbi:MAG: methylmalonyl-CoA carboxyltransferase, partial [Alicyclobacillus sp.]|nr:methylmalonyl-CoA carboxyltransferase [Alicyclobacillus sp.]